jgi:hypothetical protein
MVLEIGLGFSLEFLRPVSSQSEFTTTAYYQLQVVINVQLEYINCALDKLCN